MNILISLNIKNPAPFVFLHKSRVFQRIEENYLYRILKLKNKILWNKRELLCLKFFS